MNETTEYNSSKLLLFGTKKKLFQWQCVPHTANILKTKGFACKLLKQRNAFTSFYQHLRLNGAFNQRHITTT